MQKFASLALSMGAVFAVLVGLPSVGSAQTLPPFVQLNAVTIVGTNTVRVEYKKNFTTCAHLKLASNNQLVHTQNIFCGNSGPVIAAKTQFTAALVPGARVKLCHGNNGNICSAIVVVGTAPAAATLSEVRIIGDTVNVTYSKNFAACGQLRTSGNAILHTVNPFCVQAGTVTAPKSYFTNALIAGASVKMCEPGTQVCSGLVTVQGGTADQVTLQSVVISGPNVTVSYSKNFPTCAHLLLASNSQILHVQNHFCQNAGPVTQPRTSFNAALVSGARVKLCHGNNYGVCSAVVTVTETTPPAENELTVTVKSGPSSDIAVKNEKNIRMLGFEARADNEDVFITQYVFDAQAGNLINAQNYRLWVDTDFNGSVDTILQSGVVAQNGKVTFAQLTGGGYVVQATRTVLFEVRADVVASLAAPASLQLKFATGQTDYILAERVATGAPFNGIKTDGVCASICTVTVTTVPSTSWSFVSQGDLFVTKSSTPLRERQLLGGTLGESVLNLTFRAQNENIDVTLITILNGGGVSGLDRFELFRAGETTPFATATVGGCGAGYGANAFCARMQNRQFVVPEGQNVNVLVRPRIKTDTDGAVSGQIVDAQIVDLIGADDIAARGDASSNNLLPNDADALAEGEVFLGRDTAGSNLSILGKVNDIVLSKVVAIANANPDANGTAIPTGTNRTFAVFKLTAAANNNLKNGINKFTLSGIILNVNATNVAMDSTGFRFYNRADSTTKAFCKPINAAGTALTGTVTGTFFVLCPALQGAGVNTEIGSGTDETFALEGAITNAKISSTQSSLLQGSLQNFSDRALSGFSPAGSHVLWIDKDATFPQNSFRWIEFLETTVNSTAYQD